jgi:hypothetical protein
MAHRVSPLEAARRKSRLIREGIADEVGTRSSAAFRWLRACPPAEPASRRLAPRELPAGSDAEASAARPRTMLA